MIDENQPLLQILQKEEDGSGCQEVATHIANTTVIGAAVGGAITGVVPAGIGAVVGKVAGTVLREPKGDKICALGLGLAGSFPGGVAGSAGGLLFGVFTSPFVFFTGAPKKCTAVREDIVDMVLNRSEPAANSKAEAPQPISMQK